MKMTKFQELKALVEEIEASGDVTKFYEKNNKTAGTRLRKAMQEVKELANEVRKEVSELKNS